MGEPSWVEVARALAAAPWWEWRAGMLLHDDAGVTVLRLSHDTSLHWHGPYATSARPLEGWLRVEKATMTAGRWVPDLSDAATAGVLLDDLSRRTTVTVQTQPDPYEVSGLYWIDDMLRMTPWVPTPGEAVGRALLAVRGGR